MALRYNTILFDFDGTVMDSAPGILNCAKKTMDRFGLPHPSPEQLRRFIGPPIRVSLREVCGLHAGQLEDATAYYRAQYAKSGIFEAEVYAGMVPLLEALRKAGARLAIASIKNEITVKQTVEHFKLTRYFDAVCGADGSPDTTGKAEIIRTAVEKTGSTNGHCVLVGDSPYDAVGAEEAGVDFCAAMWGFGFVDENEAKTYPHVLIARDIPSLGAFLLDTQAKPCV